MLNSITMKFSDDVRGLFVDNNRPVLVSKRSQTTFYIFFYIHIMSSRNTFLPSFECG